MTVEYRADTDPGELDRLDPLAVFRQEFTDGPQGLLYLDGNSLGRPPRAARAAVRRFVDTEWPQQLVGGWDDWITFPERVGDQLAATVLGAQPGETLVWDSTSVNLYKLAAAALGAAGPGRRVLVTDDDNFPTDRYILRGLAEQFGATLRVIHSDIDGGVIDEELAAALGDDTAVVCLSHVAYRSGVLADMARITAMVHDAGAFMLWDLCHSAGSVPIALSRCQVDLAVGCSYKYLNSGPGAPAFLYVRKDLQSQLRQPIWGWFSQQDQFDMGPDYQPAEGIARFAVGTPPVMGIAALEGALSVTARAGMDAIRAKSQAMTQYAVALCDAQLAPLGFELASPRDPAARGGHITVAHPHAWQISQAMRQRGVIPDYRTPERIRLGFAPLYNTFGEIRDAFAHIADIVSTGQYRDLSANRTRVT